MAIIQRSAFDHISDSSDGSHSFGVALGVLLPDIDDDINNTTNASNDFAILLFLKN